MEKAFIINAVRALLDSATERGTEQGILVYTNTLEMLASAETPEQVEEIRSKLNRALVGIEAHGYLTDAEFTIVRKLRE